MTEVLLVCPEPLGHRSPAGVGIRFLEIAAALRRHDHRVILLSADGAAVHGCATGTLTPETISESSRKAGVAIVQGHAANDFFAHSEEIPTVVDLYDPFIVENFHYFETRGAEVFLHDHATLMRSLTLGDFFLCASTAQRLFYIGLLLAAGRVNPSLFSSDPLLEKLIGVAPFGVPPPRQTQRNALPEPSAFFGAIYDWYEPELAVEAVRLARNDLPSLTITFTSHPNPEITPQTTAARIEQLARREPFVRFVPWTPYEQRAATFDRHSVGLITFRRSLETELSMRTRVFDFLWGGLPVVTSSAPGTDEILRRFDAGSVVESNSPSDLANALVRIHEPQAYRTKVVGTQLFVNEFQWDATLQPLLAFCNRPRKEQSRDTFPVENRQLKPQPPTLVTRLKRKLGGLR